MLQLEILKRDHARIVAYEAAREEQRGPRRREELGPQLAYLRAKQAAWEAAGGDPEESGLGEVISRIETAATPADERPKRVRKAKRG